MIKDMKYFLAVMGLITTLFGTCVLGFLHLDSKIETIQCMLLDLKYEYLNPYSVRRQSNEVVRTSPETTSAPAFWRKDSEQARASS